MGAVIARMEIGMGVQRQPCPFKLQRKKSSGNGPGIASWNQEDIFPGKVAECSWVQC